MLKTLELNDFKGDWTVQRTIDDRWANAEGRFEGTASFRPEGAGLIYDEAGRLSMGEIASMEASQSYHWQPDGEGVAVYFRDGRFFHGFQLGARADARHFCDPDTYHVSYDFTGWPVWSARWMVKGPRKNYTMRSTYTRA